MPRPRGTASQPKGLSEEPSGLNQQDSTPQGIGSFDESAFQTTSVRQPPQGVTREETGGKAILISKTNSKNTKKGPIFSTKVTGVESSSEYVETTSSSSNEYSASEAQNQSHRESERDLEDIAERRDQKAADTAPVKAEKVSQSALFPSLEATKESVRQNASVRSAPEQEDEQQAKSARSERVSYI